MADMLPGTTIQSRVDKYDIAEQILNNIFAGGGLMLSQVSQMTGLEPYVIQNWVKRGFLSPPRGKRYSKRQFCRIIIINMLKETLQLEKITRLLSYINGDLSDESDDIIDDSKLYNYYVNLIVKLRSDETEEFAADDEALKNSITDNLNDYNEPFAGAKKRLRKVLFIMVTAHFSAMLAKKADLLLAELDI